MRLGLDRQLIVCGVLVLACAAVSDMKAQNSPSPLATPLPADIREDAYALYSDVYRNANWIKPDELLAIAMGTADFSYVKARLKPPSWEDQTLLDNFLEANKEQHRWEGLFDFGRPYKLLDAAEQGAVDNCFMARHDPNRPQCPTAFAKIRFIRFLSIPGFNRSHTRALIATSRVCGGLCGNGGVDVYRRTNRGWQREENSFASWCIWVY